MNKLRISVIVLAIIIVVLLGVLAFVRPAQGPTVEDNAPFISFDGHLTVTLPHANDVISSPVSISGSVTGGGWFFEASFPVKILDGDGTILGQNPAQAGGEPGSWMSTGTVPFADTITFSPPKYATGTIIFEKDNSSGLAKNAETLSLPIKFQ